MVDRFYLDKKLELKQIVELKDKEFHHLARVMRTKVGDIVEIINGKGSLAKAKVDELKKNSASLSIIDLKTEQKPAQEIVLAQALPRPQRLDFIIEKGTELGVTQFWLFPGENSDRKKLSSNQLERTKTLAVSALKQCGRTWLPDILIKPPLDEWPNLTIPFYFGDIKEKAPLFKTEWKAKQKAGIFIGPESGFSQSEITCLEKLGALGVKLNHNILRTETASILAVGLISHWMSR